MAKDQEAEFESLLANGSVDQLRAAFDDLVTRKKSIESQLANDKYDMLDERAEWMEKGLSARDAQYKATQGTDFDWRRRAAHALRMIDQRIPRLRQRLHVVSEHSKVQFTEVLRGSAEEIAAAVERLAARAFVQQLLSVDGAAIALCKVSK